jgi:three-Cys-motif partner protein
MSLDDKNCPGCVDRKRNSTDACCDVRLDGDGHAARCVGIWSEDKLFYLRRYATIFSSGMRHHWRNRVYIDLYAGPGRCRTRPTGAFVDGSPLIALKQPFTHYHFCDLSERVCGALDARSSALPSDERTVRVWRGDCNGLADDINREVSGLGPETLGFAFIDPPNVKSLRFDTIRRLTKGAKIDVLINFPLGMDIKRQLPHRLAEGASTEEFDAYFDGTEWREECDDVPGGGKRVGLRLLELYKRKLAGLGYKCVGDERVIKNRKMNASYYILVFASRHERGEDFWAKISKNEPSGQTSLWA